jgi:CheY-like chemotaxis protein
MSISRTILIVDDDEDILQIASTYLSNQGYTVIQAKDGAEGLRLIEAMPEIHLLFTDIVMPGDIDGFELAHRARQLRPDLRVLYTSGFLKEVPWGEKGVGYGRLLQKPWRLDALEHAVRRALD